MEKLFFAWSTSQESATLTTRQHMNHAKVYMHIASERVSHRLKVSVAQMVPFLSMFLSLRSLILTRWLRTQRAVLQQVGLQQVGLQECHLQCLLVVVCLLAVACQALQHLRATLVWTFHLKWEFQEQCLLPIWALQECQLTSQWDHHPLKAQVSHQILHNSNQAQPLEVLKRRSRSVWLA